MLIFGAPFDEENEVKLYSTGRTAHSERLPKSGLDISFVSLRLDTNPTLGINTTKPLLPSSKDYTFRNYGKMKNFTWKYPRKITTTISHIQYIRKSPRLSIDEVDDEILAGRVYGLELYSWRYPYPEPILIRGTLKLARLDDMSYYACLDNDDYAESASDVQRFLDMIADVDVIALNVEVTKEDVIFRPDFVIHVDDNTKLLLDKLMKIYKDVRGMSRRYGKMKEYMRRHNITLGMVLDNLDLYYCLSFGL